MGEGPVSPSIYGLLFTFCASQHLQEGKTGCGDVPKNWEKLLIQRWSLSPPPEKLPEKDIDDAASGRQARLNSEIKIYLEFFFCVKYLSLRFFR